MSADLFAAFGAPNPPSQSQAQSWPQQQQQPRHEEREQQQQQQSQANNSQGQGTAALASLETEHPLTSNFFDAWRPSSIDRKEDSSNVLFDATTETPSDDEEWGEFESAEPSKSNVEPEAKPQGNGIDLLSGSVANESFQFAIPERPKPQTKVVSPQNRTRPLSSTRAQSWKQQQKQAPVQQSTPAPVDLLSSVELQSTKSDASNISHAEADTDVESWADSWVAVEDDDDAAAGRNPNAMEESWADDDWGDFTTVQPSGLSKASHHTPNLSRSSIPHSQQPSIKPSRSSGQSSHTTATSQSTRPVPVPVTIPSGSASQVRPINIPPPAILLALFPSLLDEIRLQCLDSKQNSTLLASLTQTIPPFLRTMTRILLGRSVRWKRDSILSQSTRIGPAGSGRGMKLNSVNKNESIKEEREAVEVLARYRNSGGVLNSTVSTAGGGEVVQVPAEPNFVAHVKSVGAAGGAIKATHACALCGLKRDERVVKIDDQAFDNFGEWWIDHWGHRECKWFWETYECRLEHR